MLGPVPVFHGRELYPRRVLTFAQHLEPDSVREEERLFPFRPSDGGLVVKILAVEFDGRDEFAPMRVNDRHVPRIHETIQRFPVPRVHPPQSVLFAYVPVLFQGRNAPVAQHPARRPYLARLTNKRMATRITRTPQAPPSAFPTSFPSLTLKLPQRRPCTPTPAHPEQQKLQEVLTPSSPCSALHPQTPHETSPAETPWPFLRWTASPSQEAHHLPLQNTNTILFQIPSAVN